MTAETLPLQPETPNSPVGTLEPPQPIPLPPAEQLPPSPDLPYYALNEEQIRAKISFALTEAEERKATALAAGESKPAPLILLVTEAENAQLEQDKGRRVEDIHKARVMAEAERPYRDRAVRAVRKYEKIVGSLEDPNSWWTLVKEPVKSVKSVGAYMKTDFLLTRAYNAASIAGLEFDKMLEAAKPYIPKVDVSEAISSVVDLVTPDTHTEPAPKPQTLSAEISPQTETLVEQLKLDNQLAEQLQILSNTGILANLSSGEIGIAGEDGEEYPAPTPAQIRQLVERRQPLIERKARQGFTRMLVVPQAAEAAQLAAGLKQSTVAHYKNGNLHDADGLPVEIGRHNAEHPEHFEFITAPNRLKKVEDVDDEEDESATPGWKVMMVKNMPECPRREEDIVVFGGRGEFMAGLRSPKASLKALQESPVCADEKGFDLETWLAYALTEMERNGTMVDANGGTLLLGSATPGEVFTRRKRVPWIGWRSQYRKGDAQKWLKIHWGAAPAWIKQYDLGVRTAVKLS